MSQENNNSTYTALLRWLCSSLSVKSANGSLSLEANSIDSILARFTSEELATMNEQCRLQPLLFSGAEAQNQSAATVCRENRNGYFKALQMGSMQLRSAARLCAALEEHDIPCIGYRGPFAANSLYGDVALRRYADIDLLIPRSRVQDAWKIIEQQGFSLGTDKTPRGFFLRHHLHWLIKSNDFCCDVHWAVEHPYRLFRIDYDEIFARSKMVKTSFGSWREAHPEDLLLLMALQFSKLDASIAKKLTPQEGAKALFDGGKMLFKWLDAALLISRHETEIDFNRVRQIAKAWGAEREWQIALVGLKEVFQLQALADIPTALSTSAVHASSMSDGVCSSETPSHAFGRLKHLALFAGGFRAEKIGDAVAYLFAPRAAFANGLAWIGHRVKAPIVLGLAACDAFACVLFTTFLRKISPPASNRRPDPTLNKTQSKQSLTGGTPSAFFGDCARIEEPS